MGGLMGKGWLILGLISVAVVVWYCITYPYNVQAILHSFKGKPTYYCDSANASCISMTDDLKFNCSDSFITIDNPTSTETTDITNLGDDCHVVITITRSSVSGYTGTSLTCDIPTTHLREVLEPLRVGNVMPIFKYCEGSFKDKYYQTMSGLTGIPV